MISALLAVEQVNGNLLLAITLLLDTDLNPPLELAMPKTQLIKSSELFHKCNQVFKKLAWQEMTLLRNLSV